MIVLAVLQSLLAGLLSLMATVVGTVIDVGVESGVRALAHVPAGDRAVGLVRAAGRARILAGGIVALSCLSPAVMSSGVASSATEMSCRRRPGTRGDRGRRRLVEAMAVGGRPPLPRTR